MQTVRKGMDKECKSGLSSLDTWKPTICQTPSMQFDIKMNSNFKILTDYIEQFNICNGVSR